MPLGLPLLLMALLAGPSVAEASGLGDEVEAFIRAHAPGVQSVELPELSGLEPGEGTEIRLSVNPRTRFAGSVPIAIRYIREGREIRREVLTARVTQTRRVLQATRAMRRGELVRAADLEEVALPSQTVPRGAGVEKSALIGRRTIRSVPEGAIWREEWVKHAPAVSRGDPVTLLVAHGALRIQARGRARENAEIGELVRVINVDSRREVVGRVQHDGAVHVLD